MSMLEGLGMLSGPTSSGPTSSSLSQSASTPILPAPSIPKNPKNLTLPPKTTFALTEPETITETPSTTCTTSPAVTATITNPALSPGGRRRHKLQKMVLKDLEKRKRAETGASGFKKCPWRGLGANVSLFSKDYKRKMGMVVDEQTPKAGDKMRGMDPTLSKDEAELQAALSEDDEDDSELAGDSALTADFLAALPGAEPVTSPGRRCRLNSDLSDFDPNERGNNESLFQNSHLPDNTLSPLGSPTKGDSPGKLGSNRNNNARRTRRTRPTSIDVEDLLSLRASPDQVRKRHTASTSWKTRRTHAHKNIHRLTPSLFHTVFVASQSDKAVKLTNDEFGRLCRNFADNAQSPQKSYFEKTKARNIVPQPVLLSHMWGVTTEIDLTGRAFSADYIEAFAETLRTGLRPGVHTIKAGSNRMDAVAATNFFEALTEGSCQLEYLDISHNLITSPAATAIGNFLLLSLMIELDLSHNALQGRGVADLVNGLLEQTSLTKLNLCGNPLGETGGYQLAKLVESKKCTLTSLGLGWTELSGLHGEAFCLAVAKNFSLITLDMSFNTLGGATANQGCAVALGTLLKKNRSITHLDVSYNHIGTEDGKRLEQAIKPNHSLMGLHYGGNDGGWIDSRGFIKPAKDDRPPVVLASPARNAANKSPASLAPLRSPTLKNVKSNKLDDGKHASILTFPKLNCVDKACWICHNWIEETFTFNVAKNGGDEDQGPSEGVFLCLSIDTPKFTPTRMKMVVKNGVLPEEVWVINRMVPAGSVEYCFKFTKNKEIVVEHAQDQPTLSKIKGIGGLNSALNNPFAAMTKNGGKGGGFLSLLAGGMAAKKPAASGPTRPTNMWQAKMNNVQKKLNVREKAHMKELAIIQLYGSETEGEGVAQDIFSPSKKEVDVSEGIGEEHKEREEDTVGKPAEKEEKSKKGAKKGGKKDRPKSENGGKLAKSKSKTDRPKSKSGKKGPKTPKGFNSKKGGGSFPPNDEDGGGKSKSLSGSNTNSNSRAQTADIPASIDVTKIEKNTIFKFHSPPPFDCEQAKPRLLKPWSEAGGDDDDDPYGLKKNMGWDLSKSIFGQRGKGNESKDFYDLLRVHKRACAADLINADMRGLLGKLKCGLDDIDACMDVIAEFYVLVCDVFKAYTTKVDAPASLTLNTFTEFALDCEIIDHDKCNLNAVDTIFIHANLTTKKPSFAEKAYGGVLIKNTKHLMQRYQFIVSLVRISHAKNGGAGHQRGPLAASLKVLFEEHIDENAQRIEGDPYRRMYVYREEVDKVLNAKATELKAIYDKYSFTKIPTMFIPKNMLHKGMTLDEFLELLEDQEILDQTLSVREAKICYFGSLPMMENVVITPHLSMSFFDFAECLVRCSHIIYESLGDGDDNPVIPMLRKHDDSELPGSEIMEAVCMILEQFVDDLMGGVKSREEEEAEEKEIEEPEELAQAKLRVPGEKGEDDAPKPKKHGNMIATLGSPGSSRNQRAAIDTVAVASHSVFHHDDNAAGANHRASKDFMHKIGEMRHDSLHHKEAGSGDVQHHLIFEYEENPYTGHASGHVYSYDPAMKSKPKSRESGRGGKRTATEDETYDAFQLTEPDTSVHTSPSAAQLGRLLAKNAGKKEVTSASAGSSGESSPLSRAGSRGGSDELHKQPNEAQKGGLNAKKMMRRQSSMAFLGGSPKTKSSRKICLGGGSTDDESSRGGSLAGSRPPTAEKKRRGSKGGGVNSPSYAVVNTLNKYEINMDGLDMAQIMRDDSSG